MDKNDDLVNVENVNKNLPVQPITSPIPSIHVLGNDGYVLGNDGYSFIQDSEFDNTYVNTPKEDEPYTHVCSAPSDGTKDKQDGEKSVSSPSMSDNKKVENVIINDNTLEDEMTSTPNRSMVPDNTQEHPLHSTPNSESFKSPAQELLETELNEDMTPVQLISHIKLYIHEEGKATQTRISNKVESLFNTLSSNYNASNKKEVGDCEQRLMAAIGEEKKGIFSHMDGISTDLEAYKKSQKDTIEDLYKKHYEMEVKYEEQVTELETHKESQKLIIEDLNKKHQELKLKYDEQASTIKLLKASIDILVENGSDKPMDTPTQSSVTPSPQPSETKQPSQQISDSNLKDINDKIMTMENDINRLDKYTNELDQHARLWALKIH